MEFENFVRRLEREIGISGGLKPDEDGAVHLACGELIVSLLERNGRLLMLGAVCELPHHDNDRLAVALLRGNFPDRPEDNAILSMGDEKTVFLHRRIPLASAEEDELLAAFGEFAVELVTWRERVKHIVREEPTVRKDDEMGKSGFIRV